MPSNDYMMGYTTGITAAASRLGDISGMDMTGAYMGKNPTGQVPDAKNWGKEAPAEAPAKPNILGAIASTALPLIIDFVTKGAEDKKKAEVDKKAAADKKEADAKAAADKAEEREFELKKARIEAGKEETEEKKEKEPAKK